MTPNSSFVLLRLLLVAATAVIGGIAWWQQQAPSPVGAQAPENAFSAVRAEQQLRTLLAENRPHPLGSALNARVRERIVDRLQALGLKPQVQTAFVCGAHGNCGTVHNVVAEIAGQQREPAVLLAAHYDSVAAGPGASDDGVGVATVLEIARILTLGAPPAHSVILLIDDGEEAGLLGAMGFMREHPLAKTIRSVVNIEARGTSGPSYMFETNSGNQRLIERLSQVMPHPLTSSLYGLVYNKLPNDTDFTVFKRHGLIGYNLAFIGNVAHYHTPLDDLAHVDLGSLQHHGDHALALVTDLAAVPISATDQDAVWFDVLGARVFWWPSHWSGYIATALMFATLLLALLGLRRSRSEGASWLKSFLSPMIALVLAIVSAYGTVVLQQGLSTTPVPWYAYPAPALVALWAIAFTACAAVATWALPSDDFWVRLGAVWCLWAAIGTFLAFKLPEASYLFIVPTAVAVISGFLLPIRERYARSWAIFLATALPSLAAAALWFPVAFGLTEAIGVTGHPAIVGILALIGTTLMPAWAPEEGERSWWTVTVGSSVLVIALLGALLVPPFSADRPQRMSIAHVQRHGETEARWLVDASWGNMPERIHQLGQWASASSSPLPWIGHRQVAIAHAPGVDQTAPLLTLLKDTPAENDQRVVDFRLQSKRGATNAALLIPPSVDLLDVKLAGHTASWRKLETSSWYPSYRLITCLTLPPEGIDIRLRIRGSLPSLVALDLVHGLPPAGDALRAARRPLGIPSHRGDLSILIRRFSL